MLYYVKKSNIFLRSIRSKKLALVISYIYGARITLLADEPDLATPSLF